MDKTFAEVKPLYHRWCQTDITDNELIDSLIDGSKHLAEQLEEMQHTADIRLDLIHRQARELAALRQRVAVLNFENVDLRTRLTQAEQAAAPPPTNAEIAPFALPCVVMVLCWLGGQAAGMGR